MADYTLHSYFRSSCSARLRIILNVKGLEYDLVPVNLLKGEQLSAEHKALNPSGTVPLLICNKASGGSFKIGQSVAAMEYLDEVHPQNAVMPSDAKSRAVVRTLIGIIASDTQPPTNLKIMVRVRKLGGVAEQWNKELMEEGLTAYEVVAKDYAGKFSFGDELTIADACLMPAVWNAQRFGVDISQFPTLTKVVENLTTHPAVVKAHYFNQPDTPEELRIK